MNQNFSLSCLTCNSGFRIRMQAGYFNSVPFTYQCPDCKVVSNGTVKLTPSKEPFVVLDALQNCIQTNNFEDDKYAVQLSTELYTDKMKPIHDESSFHFKNLSPSMQYFSDGKQDELGEINELTEELVKNITDRSQEYTAYWDLYYQGSPKYLFKKLKDNKFIDQSLKYGDFIKLSDNKKIGFLPKYLYSSLLNKKYYKNKVSPILEYLNFSRNKQYKSFKELIIFTKNSYKENLNRIIEVNKSFCSYYNYILPVVINESIETYHVDTIKKIKGITQTDFEYLKKYYAENYENMKDFILPCILLQNLKNRDSINKFHPNFYRDFRKAFSGKDPILDFNQTISKVGNRTKILLYDADTIINRDLLKDIFDNKIRNSINHQDYKYNYNQQLITFIDKNSEVDLYLIEFAKKIFSGFIFSNVFWDVYMLLIDLFQIKEIS